jgi:hypothetical protein
MDGKHDVKNTAEYYTNSMKTLKITVRGYVQKVGYREEVEQIARELGIVGYAKNLKDNAYKRVQERYDWAKIASQT